MWKYLLKILKPKSKNYKVNYDGKKKLVEIDYSGKMKNFMVKKLVLNFNDWIFKILLKIY